MGNNWGVAPIGQRGAFLFYFSLGGVALVKKPLRFARGFFFFASRRLAGGSGGALPPQNYATLFFFFTWRGSPPFGGRVIREGVT